MILSCSSQIHTLLVTLIAVLCLASTVQASARGRGTGEPTPFPQVVTGGEKDWDQPAYPVTAAWFRDRFSAEEWLPTLGDFRGIGGDTVLLRAPQMKTRSPSDIKKDPEFAKCIIEGADCVTQTQTDLTRLSLNIKMWATFSYEEDYSKEILKCPEYDIRINTSNSVVYHRIVLPLDPTMEFYRSCDYPAGTAVLVLFTSFSGIDPHVTLARAAAQQNISVYLALPAAPRDINNFLLCDAMPAYLSFVERYLQDHVTRYNLRVRGTSKTLYDVIKGYYSSDEICLADLIPYDITVSLRDSWKPTTMSFLQLYIDLGKLIQGVTNKKKQFALSPTINLYRVSKSATVSNHVTGFEVLAMTGLVDIIAVNEGRGTGLGAYYWPNEGNVTIATVDPILFRILKSGSPGVSSDITFDEIYKDSIQTLFQALGESRDTLRNKNVSVDLWLNIDAYENLRDNPCLPADLAGSGNPEAVDRVSKARMDRAITASGAIPNKIVAFAWDPGFTCKQKPPSADEMFRKGLFNTNSSLADDIRNDLNRPIVSTCRFHSRQNMSIVLIGYNLGGLTQVNWTDWKGNSRSNAMYGYYFEMDYGSARGLVPSLMYTQLFDLWNLEELKTRGYITILPDGAFNKCTFWYDCGDVPTCV